MGLRTKHNDDWRNRLEEETQKRYDKNRDDWQSLEKECLHALWLDAKDRFARERSRSEAFRTKSLGLLSAVVVLVGVSNWYITDKNIIMSSCYSTYKALLYDFTMLCLSLLSVMFLLLGALRIFLSMNASLSKDLNIVNVIESNKDPKFSIIDYYIKTTFLMSECIDSMSIINALSAKQLRRASIDSIIGIGLMVAFSVIYLLWK